ncbi:MAG: polyprenol monophosphomannose synthase [Nitrososphaeria archaeon]|nr:polyprenol monophosphomannose synthase [Nitrososphaeria archaeon]MDW8043622.1 polyprenol monophosphomannose synthase [Nitrososphaerota archaeon]
MNSGGPRRADIAVVIPTYNEAETIGSAVRGVVEAASGAGLECVVLVVDDSSPDGTAEVVRRLAGELGRVELLVRPGRMGIGSAYVDGFRHAVERFEGLKAVVEMDADGSHDPSYLQALVGPVLSGTADVAIGSRYVPGGSWEGGQTFRELVSRGANLLARVCTGLKVRDATSGYRAISADLLRRCSASLRASSRGYVFQVESLATFAAFSARVVEVPIAFRPRAAGKSKLRFEDVVTFAAWNLRFLLKRMLGRTARPLT